jgi:serine/threonine protein kinase
MGKSPASIFLAGLNGEEVAPQPDDEGQVVGTEYVLGKQIGFGGFSTVKEAFKVKDDGETERFAVKIVKKHLTGKSERENDQVQAEFDHEVRVWRYLNHPNILPLEAVYETDYATFCFTHLTTGGTLFELVRRHRNGLKINIAKQYAYQLASAIRYLHEDARVVHRDIKLENCLLDSPVLDNTEKVARLILCDFGMAEWMTTDNGGSSPDPYDNAADRPPPKNIGPSDTSTSGGGSLEYASPELLSSPGGLLSPVVDIWAFGVVVFALLVGSRPFHHPFEPRIQMNIREGHWDRNAVLKGEEDKQERLDALDLIQCCLEMDPVKRWSIRQIIGSRWFHSCSDHTGDTANDTSWKF